MCAAQVAIWSLLFPRADAAVTLARMIDVEIAGASFAGLACARTCAARGLRTVVWERNPTRVKGFARPDCS